MIQEDTIKLLRECNAGIKMGVDSIDEILDETTDRMLIKMLRETMDEHKRLGSETHRLLNRYGDEGKDPNPLAKSMSWIKTNVMMAVDAGDNTIADLITDGCNMGVKSLSRYLNKYEAADEESKNIAKQLIACEAGLAEGLRAYL
ncbi:uncharacterized protein BN553_01335 [Firmicutes bacterium CAG:238]|jgi:hypothetical protein|nr:uncharacterized protein BN553_01335 [Firmicutes bacterium CAG:238]